MSQMYLTIMCSLGYTCRTLQLISRNNKLECSLKLRRYLCICLMYSIQILFIELCKTMSVDNNLSITKTIIPLFMLIAIANFSLTFNSIILYHLLSHLMLGYDNCKIFYSNNVLHLLYYMCGAVNRSDICAIHYLVILKEYNIIQSCCILLVCMYQTVTFYDNLHFLIEVTTNDCNIPDFWLFLHKQRNFSKIIYALNTDKRCHIVHNANYHIVILSLKCNVTVYIVLCTCIPVYYGCNSSEITYNIIPMFNMLDPTFIFLVYNNLREILCNTESSCLVWFCLVVKGIDCMNLTLYIIITYHVIIYNLFKCKWYEK